MYQAHWGLRESPFAKGLDRSKFFRSPTHDEALARLHFLVDERRRLGLLLGPSGSGKSLVQEVLAYEATRDGAQAAKVNLLALSEGEFLFQLADALRLFPARGEPPHWLWRRIVDRLAEHRLQQVQTVILLDDVDETHPETLEQVVRLVQHDTHPASQLTIVLAAAPHRVNRLGYRLPALADLRVDLEPWDAEDTTQFVVETLQRCGRSEPLFTDQALRRLHDLAAGTPRRVCQLADLCLLAGAAQGLESIDEATVDTVSQELGVREVFAPQRVG